MGWGGSGGEYGGGMNILVESLHSEHTVMHRVMDWNEQSLFNAVNTC